LKYQNASSDQHATGVDFVDDNHPAKDLDFRGDDSSLNPSKGENNVH
jgi:hypothetical protein